MKKNMFLTQRGGLGMKDGMMNSMNQKLKKKYTGIKEGFIISEEEWKKQNR